MYKVEFRARRLDNRVTLTVTNLETIQEVLILSRGLIEGHLGVIVRSIILAEDDSWEVFDSQGCIGYLWITEV